MSQALYRKYRPKGWAEVIGQDHVVETLKNAIAADRVGHAYLFSGPRGTGKTTLARILAKAVNCLAEDARARPCNSCDHCKAVNENRFLDLIEMDAASNTGVDDVRDLRDKINFSPSQGKFKIYIIDEVHMLSTPAFNALLKTLEEPPPHAIFVLATTEIHKIPATVISRCQRHEFRRVPVVEILGNLRHIVQVEGLRADEDALLLIARQATGSLRDAQSLLDQLSSAGSHITLELAERVLGTATSQAVIDLIDSIQTGEAGTGLERLHAALDSGADPRTLARQIVEYLRGLILIQMGNSDAVEATKDTRQRMAAHATAFSTPAVVAMMKAFNSAATDTRGGWQPSLSLELAVVEALDPSGAAAAPPGGVGESRQSYLQGVPGSNASAAAPLNPRTKPPSAEASRSRDASSAKPGAPAQREPVSLVEPSKISGKPESRQAGVGLPEITKAWKDVRAAIKPLHPALEALLNSCKPVDVRGDELLLGFQSETVRALMDKPENLEVTRKAIEQLMGLPLSIKCVVMNVGGKVPPNVSQDGMVATALNQGGEIVDLEE
jgi:DNA polymerase-3 subunit gamma/tau